MYLPEGWESWGIYTPASLHHWLRVAPGALTPSHFWPILYPGSQGRAKALRKRLQGSGVIQGCGQNTDSIHCIGILHLFQDIAQLSPLQEVLSTPQWQPLVLLALLPPQPLGQPPS